MYFFLKIFGSLVQLSHYEAKDLRLNIADTGARHTNSLSLHVFNCRLN